MANFHWSQDELESFFELCGDGHHPDWKSIVAELNKLYHNNYEVRTVNSARHKYRLKKDKWVSKPTKSIDSIKDIVERDHIQHLEGELKKIRRGRAFEELLIETIRGAAPVFKVPPAMPVIKPCKGKTDTRLILALADHHANRVVDPRSIENFNAYNFDIYARRLYSVIKRTIRIAQAQYTTYNRITGLSVNCLGDIGNDSHRTSAIATNEMSENVASLAAGHIIAQAMDCLLRAKTPDGQYSLFPSIEFRGVVGNEARMDKKLDWQQPWRSWDWLIYQWVSASLGSNSRISYIIPYSMKYVVEELGWRFLLDHGHEIRSWAGIPFYGIRRSNAGEQYLRRDRGGFDYRMTGHLHILAALPEYCRQHYICPSLVGADGYSHNALGVSGDYGQLLLAVSEEMGVIGQFPVYATEEEESPFVYDVDLAIEGAHRAMEEWRKKDIKGIG